MVSDLKKSAETLYIEKQLEEQSSLLIGESCNLDQSAEGCNCTSLVTGSYSIAKVTDEKSVFNGLWGQSYDKLIDPTKNCGESQSNLNINVNNNKSSVTIVKERYISTDDYIKVSQAIVFSKQDLQCGFKGKLLISNISKDYITYRVCSSNTKKFRYFPDDIGWIAPNTNREIFVQTNRLFVIKFEDIISESFLVQATPVLRKEQLDMNCLNILWKACGSDMFPDDRIEEHLITDIFPHDSKYLDNFSILGRLQFAFFKKIRDIEEIPPTCSEQSFYEHWPVDTVNYDAYGEQAQRAGIVMEQICDIKKKSDCLLKRFATMMYIASGVLTLSSVSYLLYDGFDLSDLYL